MLSQKPHPLQPSCEKLSRANFHKNRHMSKRWWNKLTTGAFVYCLRSMKVIYFQKKLMCLEYLMIKLTGYSFIEIPSKQFLKQSCRFTFLILIILQSNKENYQETIKRLSRKSHIINISPTYGKHKNPFESNKFSCTHKNVPSFLKFIILNLLKKFYIFFEKYKRHFPYLVIVDGFISLKLVWSGLCACLPACLPMPLLPQHARPWPFTFFSSIQLRNFYTQNDVGSVLYLLGYEHKNRHMICNCNFMN